MKKVIIMGLIVLIAGAGFGIFHLYHSSDNPSPPDNITVETLIHNVTEAAKSGTAPSVPFVVGKTDMDAIQNNWGTPSEVSKTDVGIYASYNTKATVFGYYRNTFIFDIRSYDEFLRRITQNDVKNHMGEPDSISYFNSADVHQQIFTYQMSPDFQLKWVMDTPTDQTPNPAIDHISVYNQVLAKNSIPAKVYGMTLEEKIGQMFMVGINGTTPGDDATAMIVNHHVGGIIFYGKNMQSPKQTVALTNSLKSLNRSAQNKVPLFVSVDQEGGVADRMPSPILKMPSSQDVGKAGVADLSRHIGQVLGKECSLLGFNMDYAPVLDVATNPETAAIGTRSLGSNPSLVSRLGTATMEGIQSQNVISVLKHFPGYGSVSIDVHEKLASIAYGLAMMEKMDLPPYENAMEHGADMVMVTHLLVPKLDGKYPASMSKEIITNLLRNKLGFDGVIITDDMTMGAIEKNYDIQTAAVKSIQAGADVVMVAYHLGRQEAAIEAVRKAVLDGSISEDRIDDSVERILELKEKYQLSDLPVVDPDITQLNREIQWFTKNAAMTVR